MPMSNHDKISTSTTLTNHDEIFTSTIPPRPINMLRTRVYASGFFGPPRPHTETRLCSAVNAAGRHRWHNGTRRQYYNKPEDGSDVQRTQHKNRKIQVRRSLTTGADRSRKIVQKKRCTTEKTPATASSRECAR